MTEEIFEIGQIFENEYPPEAAMWCNEQENPYICIEEIDSENNIRRFQIVDNSPPSEVIAQLKAEQTAKLSLTAADVERAVYKAFGKDFDDIIAMVEELNASGTADIDVKALKIELKANNFYRGNPYISQIGALLGVTETQLDEFFKTNDYTKLLPADAELLDDDEIPF